MNPIKNQQPPGFSCPNCNFFIEVSLKSLLLEGNQACPSCQTSFSMDHSESKEALDLMNKLKTNLSDLDKMKDSKD